MGVRLRRVSLYLQRKNIASSRYYSVKSFYATAIQIRLSVARQSGIDYSGIKDGDDDNNFR